MNPTIMRFWQQQGLTVILSLAGLASIAAIGVETQWGTAVHLPATRSGAGASGAPEILATYPVFTLASLNGSFTETAERPLFLPSRRPVPIGPAASAQVMKKGQYKLSGTTVEKELAVAYLVEAATNKTVRVTKGKEVLGVPGLVVDQVEATRVVLKMGEDTETLELRTAASPPKPASPPGGAPATGAPGMPSAPGVAPVAGVQPVPQPSPATFAPPPAVAPAVAPAQAAGAAMQPGSSVMPGFVLPSGAAGQTPAPTDAAAAQRRRRFQNLPQQ